MPRQNRRIRRVRRVRLERKYAFRRIMLAILLAVAAGLLIWLLPFGGGEEPVIKSEQIAEPEPQSSEPESEPEPEPEPEPETDQPVVSDGDWRLLLVNGSSPLPDNFEVALTAVDGYEVDSRIVDDLLRMFLTAKESGIELMLCSAYRSIDKQQANYESSVKSYIDSGYSEEDAEAMTAAYYQKPGESEHHTGLAVDIVTPEYQTLDEGFTETAAFKWLDANSYKFGFILRYPKNKEDVTKINYEPWHYRYVGEEHAAAIKESGYCLEEYLYISKKEQLDRALYEAEAEPVVEDESTE